MLGLSLGIPFRPYDRSAIQQMLDALRRNNGSLWYVPENLSGVYVDNVGTTPVTAVGALIGLITDKSYGGQLGVELVTVPTVMGAAIDGTTAVTPYVVGAGMTVGKSYRCTYKVSGYTGSNDVGFASGSFAAVVGASRATANGTYSFVGVVVNPDINVFSRPISNTANFSEITVREVPGNHATQSAVASKPSVQRVPKRLGPNLVSNETFDTDTAWIKGEGWTISGGKAVRSTSAFGSVLSQPAPLTAGKGYVITYSVSDFVSGSANISFAGGTQVNGLSRTSNGAFSDTLTAMSGNTSLWVVTGTGSTNLSVDNIEVREVLEWANVISFDGSNDFLQTGITTGNEGWVCAGVNITSLATNQVVISSGAQAGGNPGISLNVRTTGQVWAGRANTSTVDIAASASGSIAIGVPCVLEASYAVSGASVRKDGIEIATSAVSVPAIASADPLCIGAVAGASPTEYLNGPMHAFSYTPVLPSAADRATIRDGIAALQGRVL